MNPTSNPALGWVFVPLVKPLMPFIKATIKSATYKWQTVTSHLLSAAAFIRILFIAIISGTVISGTIIDAAFMLPPL